jgi:L-asparaginase
MNITIITTGGTIEKTYIESEGNLRNDHSILKDILKKLRLPDLKIYHKEILHKDSLDLTEEDRKKILVAVKDSINKTHGIIILHGTDTLTHTGNLLYSKIHNLHLPIILTGAMRPYEYKDSDAIQNVIESLMAVKLINPGIYLVMHNKILRFPGIKKDYKKMTFIQE